MPDLSALPARAERKLWHRDAQCDVKIGDHVWSNFRERHLFLAYAPCPRRGGGELAQRRGAPQPLLAVMPIAAWRRLNAAIDAMPDMDTMEEPIDPLVALGWGWGNLPAGHALSLV